ncbi:hypothetical protein [Actinoallomurus sp. NPDC052274]|uniref:hypothetical protein n=1 Tax=Actinoallomurus sp. NPDC052274 TaxID=3155420 RepID=UPI003434F9CC
MFEGSLEAAQIAVYTTAAASLVIPTAGPLAVDMYKSQCDPSAFWSGAETWWQVADTMWKAADQAQKVHDKAQSDDWSGGDPEAFKKQLGEYKTQLELSALLCNLIAIVLWVTAVLLFLLILAMVFIAAVLAAFLILIAAETAVTLGVGYGPIVAEVSSIVSSINVGFWEPMSGMLETTLNSFALLLGGSLIAELAGQVVTGNPGALKDVVFAQAPAIDVIFRGTLNRLERKATADLMAGGVDTRTTALSKIPLIQKIPFVDKAVGAFPDITKIVPDGPVARIVGLGAMAKGSGGDTATQNYPLTGKLIGRDNDQVG